MAPSSSKPTETEPSVVHTGGAMGPEERSQAVVVAEAAVAAVGCGYNLCDDLRLSRSKPGPSGGRLIDLDVAPTDDLVLPGGVAVPGVPGSIKCDKGERTRFCSDVLSFHEMSEQFNQGLSLSGKIPSGSFNAMFNLRGCWKKDASLTKNLAFDGWFITLYSIELDRSQIVLDDRVKEEVPCSWDPAGLAEFIEKYGTHIIVGVKMGGKDVIYVKQQHDSVLQQTEVQLLLKKLTDEKFSEDFNGNFILGADELLRKMKDNKLEDPQINMDILKSIRPSVVSHSKKDDITSIHVRKGGINANLSHNQWLSTISEAPDVISMSFVPITSLLGGVRGAGFLNHAVNLYLRYKPPLGELHQFLEFQLPRQWAPVFGELPLGPHHRKHSLPSLQFTLLGPRLHVNTVQVDSGNRPVTGIRLFLEGKRNDCLAIHLQHLSALPAIFQLSDDAGHAADDAPLKERAYYVPIKWALLSHVCTAPVQYSGARIDESASVVTKAWLEVRDIGMRKVLFLRLGFSNVACMRNRRSEWDGPTSVSRRSGSISALIGNRFSTGLLPSPTPNVEVNSAVYPGGPPIPIRVPRMSRFVDTTEMMRGPDDLPGYWVVTGAKLCVEGGKISLRVKYSLLVPIPEDDL